MLIALTAPVWSQTGVSVWTHDGAEHQFAIEANGGIYFTNNNQIEVREGLGNGADDYFEISEVKKITFDQTLGINEAEASQLRIFPNPATNHISIIGAEEGSLVKIYDMLGKAVVSQRCGNGTIDIAQLAPGIYVVKTEGATLKFIKR